MSGAMDAEKAVDILELLEINLKRVADKYQHLVQAIRYLGDDIAVLQNNFGILKRVLKSEVNKK